MNSSELNAKRAMLHLLAREIRRDGDVFTAESLEAIRDDLGIYYGMPPITFEGDSKTAECGDGTEDIFQVDDHHECVRVICTTNDNCVAPAGRKFSEWLQRLALRSQP